ncbi:MAG: Nif3-like dinuclear metal center hexameric protein [Patescibacteria group bacterium]
MQIERDKIVKYCEDYLKVKDFKDYCVNGLQIEGDPKVSKIITGVSLSKQLIEVAIKKEAKMIIVHHGIFKNQIGELPQIKGVLKNRLRILLENNINLLGFHLPLDAHPIIGNNISLLKLLDLKKVGAINTPDYGEIGYIGEVKQEIKFNDFVALVNERLQTNSYVIPSGPKIIKKVGIISGGASPNFKETVELGADTFICGDIREEIVRAVEEVKINFINAGHYNTEKLGIQNLGNLIANKFKIKVEFIDIPCDI